MRFYGLIYSTAINDPTTFLILLVTPRGFEPPTNRTGICHSIQLNYGAVLQRYCENCVKP